MTAKIPQISKIPVPRLGATNRNPKYPAMGKTHSAFHSYTLFVPIPASRKRMPLRKNYKYIPLLFQQTVRADASILLT